MKKLLLAINTLLMLLLAACSDSGVCRIEGKITNLEDDTIYVVFESEEMSMVDTIECYQPGRFRTELHQEGFRQATFFFDDRTAWFTVYLDDLQANKIEITGDVRFPTLLYAKGGRTNNELSTFRKKVEALLREDTKIRQTIVNASLSQNNELISRSADIKNQLNEQALIYIHDNPAKAASAVLIKTYFADPNDTRRIDELLITLSPEIQDHYLVSDLQQYSIRAKRTALGAEAPDFAATNIYGYSVSLDSFPQKYLLLTFTAPWCDMCRIDELYLNEIDRKYTKDQIEQLLITLDDDLVGLRSILKTDSIKWNLIADSAGQATQLFDLYNVSMLPRCFLIDEEGKIILKTENGVEIKQTLERLIQKEI
ncbi:MAG: AhpC/TSA family protein [Tannerellaceae bacterium]|jgi:peroxiredoxin|nr:AhpC/TSA family protein [Tannerellaceae bacterium]